MSEAALVTFVEQVVEEPELWPELLALKDRDSFAERVSELAVGRGLDVTAEDVDRALTAGRREWLERWV